MQQLRGRRPRGDGARATASSTPREEEGADIDRAVGPDHAVARRDGARRRARWSGRASHAAPDRRRDHQREAHRREDRARLRRAGRPRARRLARGGRGVAPARPRRARRRSPPRTARSRSGCASAYARRTRAPAPAARRGARASGSRSTGRRATCQCRRSPAGAMLRDVPLGEIVPLHRLDVLLHRLGAAGQVPRDPRPPDVRRRPRATCSTTRRRCSTSSSPTGTLTARGVVRLLAGERRRRRHRDLHRRGALRELVRFPMLRQQQAKADGKADCCARRLRGAARVAARSTTSAPSR